MEKAFHVNTPFFNPKDTLECGQVFRYQVGADGSYTVISGDKRCVITESSFGGYDFFTDFGDYFYDYFDFNRDYEALTKALLPLPLMPDAVEAGKGIRILKQQPFETVISFIVSANNHIPRIKGIIERICNALGEEKDGYYAFPTAEAMAKAGRDFYKSIGAGYRDAYLQTTAEMLYKGEVSLAEVAALPTENAKKELCRLMGVGGKVADCILQYGFGRSDVFPTDTWIKKMYAEAFGGEPLSGEKIREKLVGIYGEYSGYAQQYLFYRERNK